MAFDRFNDKPPRREKRAGEHFGSKGGRFEDSGRDRGFGRNEGRSGDRFGSRFERKPFGGKSFAGRPFKEELGGRSGPRAKAVDKRRFSDRAAFVQNATVRLDTDVAKFFKSAEDVNAALRMVIALSKTVKPEDSAEQVGSEQGQVEAIEETAGETEQQVACETEKDE